MKVRNEIIKKTKAQKHSEHLLYASSTAVSMIPLYILSLFLIYYMLVINVCLK